MTPSAADGHDRKQLATERPVTESRIEREGLKAGTRAPLFTLPDLRGRALSLEDCRGRRVLLVFSDPNCGPCSALAPELVRLDAENSALQLLMVSRGELEENRLKAQEHGFAFPLVLQDKWNLSKEYGIFATPVAFLINEDGVIEQPVAIGVDGILALAGTAAAPPAISRWRAIGRIAAGFLTAIIMTPLRAAAALVCPPGRVNCGGVCADLNSDPHNCGACGRACPPGQICEPPSGRVGANVLIESKNGMCRPCTAPNTICSATAVTAISRPLTIPSLGTETKQLPGGSVSCVDLRNDPRNCGACGKTCPAGETCANGTCRPCTAPNTMNAMCSGSCVDLANDPRNCGACGKICPPDKTCWNGACRGLACAADHFVCAGKCVEKTNSDPLNCGACGKACPSGVCVAGACQPCATGQVICAGKCVNLSSDSRNCGACGLVCAPGQICQNGVCSDVPCPPGLQRCYTFGQSTCVNIGDSSNCGGCGNFCRYGQRCNNGVCVCDPALCLPGQTCKNGVCA
jgi:peroxiredoxin